MAKLSSFTFITLNGFYKGSNEDITWHKQHYQEPGFAAENLKSENILLFGRKTYDMMAFYWTSPMAKQNDPVVAEGMNTAEKIVFSRSMEKADWNNTRLVKDDMLGEVRRLKESSSKNLTILGSGSILSQLADEDIIDEYLFMLDPVAIGDGSPVFKDIREELHLQLVDTRALKTGVVLLRYRRGRS